MAKLLLLLVLASAVVRLLTRAAFFARSLGSSGGRHPPGTAWGPFSGPRSDASTAERKKERRRGELVACERCGDYVPRDRTRDLQRQTLCRGCASSAE